MHISLLVLLLKRLPFLGMSSIRMQTTELRGGRFPLSSVNQQPTPVEVCLGFAAQLSFWISIHY